MRFNQFLILLLVSGATTTLACSSESDAVSRRDCERLRDHLVDVRMQSVTADQDQHRIALRSSLDESFITTCVDSSDSSYLRCALAATNNDALLACTEPSTEPSAR